MKWSTFFHFNRPPLKEDYPSFVVRLLPLGKVPFLKRVAPAPVPTKPYSHLSHFNILTKKEEETSLSSFKEFLCSLHFNPTDHLLAWFASYQQNETWLKRKPATNTTLEHSLASFSTSKEMPSFTSSQEVTYSSSKETVFLQHHFYHTRILEKYAQQKETLITLRQLEMFARTMSPFKLLRSATFLRNELLIRWSHQLRHFQSLPYVITSHPSFHSVYVLTWQSFTELLHHFPTSFEETDEKNSTSKRGSSSSSASQRVVAPTHVHFCYWLHHTLQVHLHTWDQLSSAIDEVMGSIQQQHQHQQQQQQGNQLQKSEPERMDKEMEGTRIHESWDLSLPYQDQFHLFLKGFIGTQLGMRVLMYHHLKMTQTLVKFMQKEKSMETSQATLPTTPLTSSSWSSNLSERNVPLSTNSSHQEETMQQHEENENESEGGDGDGEGGGGLVEKYTHLKHSVFQSIVQSKPSFSSLTKKAFHPSTQSCRQECNEPIPWLEGHAECTHIPSILKFILLCFSAHFIPSSHVPTSLPPSSSSSSSTPPLMTSLFKDIPWFDRVTLCQSKDQVMIRLSTTSPGNSSGPTTPSSSSSSSVSSLSSGTWNSPWWVGKTCLEYYGGTVHVVHMNGYGTDLYLTLNKHGHVPEASWTSWEENGGVGEGRREDDHPAWATFTSLASLGNGKREREKNWVHDSEEASLWKVKRVY